jgi:hypothetical protein
MPQAFPKAFTKAFPMVGYAALLALVVVLAALPTGPLQATTTRQVEKFQGVARTAQGDIAYTERHQVVYENGRHRQNQTRYLDASGREIATLDSEFNSHPYLPDYRFSDRRFGREDGTRVTGRQVQVYGREDGKSPLQEKVLTLTDVMITGQGLHFYIRDHLKELAHPGAVKRVDFLVPLDGTSYAFRILPLAGGRPGTVSFKIESDSFLLRLVAPSLEVTYDLASGQLLSYRGLSNLLSADRGPQQVEITYQYDAS